MSKALASGADAVIFDLEDSVPIAAKAEARTYVAKAIDGVAAAGAAHRGIECLRPRCRRPGALPLRWAWELPAEVCRAAAQAAAARVPVSEQAPGLARFQKDWPSAPVAAAWPDRLLAWLDRILASTAPRAWAAQPVSLDRLVFSAFPASATTQVRARADSEDKPRRWSGGAACEDSCKKPDSFPLCAYIET